MTAEALIRLYYTHFNTRRLEDAASLIAPHAALEQLLTGPQQPGPRGYLEFAKLWLHAFPDAVFTIENISSADGATYNVDLLSSGKHRGTLGVGGLVFRPHGADARLRLRELLQIRQGAIVASTLSFDLQDIIRQLVHVDSAALLSRLTRIFALAEELKLAQTHEERSRELVQRIGFELDAARHVVRPYFK
ncbi:MAG TPA: ester cyclase [Vicinamibacterales bacterium]|nr:ester cyclase [Vicinamibacterales bacterium]